MSDIVDFSTFTEQQLRDLTFITSLLDTKPDMIGFVDAWLTVRNVNPLVFMIEYALARRPHLLAEAREAVNWYLAHNYETTMQQTRQKRLKKTNVPSVAYDDDALDPDMPF